ncbi:SPOR domain-containing protein [Sinimarinibacterium sp. NLF-5-8]|uniref:SPOR domain-containing protein n=1 Tax=Sinimarinibacterium sp. NLF-5-8 TaxID=2698684 RepID=UPI00137BD488|nr:SPOR domain-containing protein [Sinimarinibacterium sp. NLF-5-8]QHS09725.1 SPOR domain-containing protein [Sinimarinibacterium sp. NLF-5-8]
MDEQHKRRWIGAALIVAMVAVVAMLLPSPRLQPRLADGEQVVSISLVDSSISYLPPTPAPTLSPAHRAEQEAEQGGEQENFADPLATPSTVPATASPRPVATPQVKATARPTVRPTLNPTASPTASPTTHAAPVATAAPTVAATAMPTIADSAQWWLQVGSYGEINNAREAETQLRALGQTVIVAPIAVGTATLYRVRSGPYASEALVQRARAQAAAAGYADAQIIKP